MDCDIPYYEYYDYQISDHVTFISDSGNEHECVYYLYTPKDGEMDENTPVIVYVTHGGGMVDEERGYALNCAAEQDTEAIIVSPTMDRPDGICASIEDAKRVLDGKGDFDNVSVHGTSSGGRAVIRAALKSVDADENYGFRIRTICAYDPAKESKDAMITTYTDELTALAKQGTVFFIQTDQDLTGHHGGSGGFCNAYARLYSEHGGTAIVAQMYGADHEGKFQKPLTHNSLNWIAGLGELVEDERYQNDWFYYKDGEKIPTTLEEATEILHREQEKNQTPDCCETRPPWIGWPAPYRPYPHVPAYYTCKTGTHADASRRVVCPMSTD